MNLLPSDKFCSRWFWSGPRPRASNIIEYRFEIVQAVGRISSFTCFSGRFSTFWSDLRRLSPLYFDLGFGLAFWARRLLLSQKELIFVAPNSDLLLGMTSSGTSSDLLLGMTSSGTA